MKFTLAIAAFALAAPALAEAPPSRIAAERDAAIQLHQNGCSPRMFLSSLNVRLTDHRPSSADSAAPSGIADLPSCIQSCLVCSKGCEPGDVACSCTSTKYRDEVKACFDYNECSSADQFVADKQHEAQCAASTLLPLLPVPLTDLTSIVSSAPFPSSTGPVAPRDLESSLSSVLSSLSSAGSSALSSLSSASPSARSSLSSRVASASSVLSSLSSAASSAVNTSPNAAPKAWSGMGAGAWGIVVVAVAGVLVGGVLVV
ncbi:hypothetical protein FA95DRAFT_1608137 [Auriscalpium vulgare]|uniref:Uncharacterized protein n=1 Tax=Auriscalpium vulgare TaxID=40419 RepID=A0ACB8RMA2_9AGAM|nr:hypothetical protein FA95DRAFT_1608137 [Auriscalpium vulgare]